MKNKKQWLLLSLVFFLVYSIPVKSKDRVVNRPHWLYSTSKDLELTKVILTDTATVLSFAVRSISTPWALAPTMHLEANGKSYGYRSGNLFTREDKAGIASPFNPGITNKCSYALIGDEYCYTKNLLVLRFEPLPSGTRYFDFVEGKDDNLCKIYGVKTDGKRYPSSLPKESKRPNIPLPAYKPKAGKAIVKGHIYGYDPSIFQVKIGYAANKYSLSGRLHDFQYDIDSLGNFFFEGEITHPIPFRCILPGREISTVLVPGEVHELDFDIVAGSVDSPYSLSGLDKVFQFKGKYGAINEVVNCDFPDYTFEIDYLKDILKLSFDEYAEDIWKRHQKMMKDIAKDRNLNMQQRGFMQMKAEAYYLDNRISYLDLIEMGLLHSGIEKDSLFGKYKAQFTLKDPHCKELNLFKDLRALYVIYDYKLMDYMEANGLIENEVYRWMLGLKRAKDLCARINLLQPVTDPSDWESIAPEYRSYLQQLNDTILEKMRLLREETTTGKIREVPDVPGDQLIQALVDRYKGKVLLIDCWATWCGPCRMGIQKMKPLQKELEGKDVAFVYLTDETSDATAWMKDVENMKGDHYRISNDKWSQLPNISAIPHYLLFDKDGKLMLDKEAWDDEWIGMFKTAILKALEE